MVKIDIKNLISKIQTILLSNRDSRSHLILDTLSERWKSDALASRILYRFRHNPEEFSPFLEDLCREKLPHDLKLAGILNQIAFEEDTAESSTAELSADEIDVLKALEQIGGGGSPIDIAVEGMLDIDRTHQTAERLWHKGLLLSHPLKDPDAKRFFSFSDLNRPVYKKLLETSNARMAEKS